MKQVKEKESKGQKNSRAIIIEKVLPSLEYGRYPVKRIVGEKVQVDAIIIIDGHDELGGNVFYRHEKEKKWHEIPLTSMGNDLWRAEFRVQEIGTYFFRVEAYLDEFKTWYLGNLKKIKANEFTPLDFVIGSQFLRKKMEALNKSTKENKKNAELLEKWTEKLARSQSLHEMNPQKVQEVFEDPEFQSLVDGYKHKHLRVESEKTYEVWVDREQAGFSAWYEFFPRSFGKTVNQHGTFKDCERMLSYVASLGFDVVYLPPIHPIGTSFRKGRNNALKANANDPGSPWGIGAKEGGHKAIHPQLGTISDFKEFVRMAQRMGIEIALDIAFQCSPEHPYVQEHPEWFRMRPDGTIQYAENPPKKYQDIYPFDFESENYLELWEELKSVFLFWREQGVRIFRVDNPHTKPFNFWKWLIQELRKVDPSIILLSEAFTRPNMMYHLAKIGFHQSYTYFTWRSTKEEFIQYMKELCHTEIKEFYRPNFWPNTPDILSGSLRNGNREAFMIRFLLAATLSANYGIYGPAFELGENYPRDNSSEEYMNSEKYEIKAWNLEDPSSLAPLIRLVNKIRKDNLALQRNDRIHFHGIDNDQLLCFSKSTEDFQNVILVVIKLDVLYNQSGWTDLDLEEMGFIAEEEVDLSLASSSSTSGSHGGEHGGKQGGAESILNLSGALADRWEKEEYEVTDLLKNISYSWKSRRNFILLKHGDIPAHIFRVEKRGRIVK